MNTPWSERPWRRVAVYGLGLSGRAAARFLAERGVSVVVTDDAGRPADLAAITGSGLIDWLAPGADLPDGLDALVVSPGVPPERRWVQSALARHLLVLSEVELAFPFLDGPVVAITGSNGKSTTTAWVGAMIAAAGRPVVVAGNIGAPLTAQLSGPPVEDRVFVVELSSYQLEAIHRFRPVAAALLNLAPDHLDRYGDLQAYGAAKRRIFENQHSTDVAVLNADDPYSRSTPTAARRRMFSRQGSVEDGCYLDGSVVVEAAPGTKGETGETLFALDELHLAGAHNIENAMAAALLALAVGVPREAIRRALGSFAGLPHRLERVDCVDGVTYYDDSKGTNPHATLGSLAGFEAGTVHLILGGRSKGLGFAELRAEVSAKAKQVYLIGEAAQEIEQALAGTVPTVPAGTLERAVLEAAAVANPGESVVLSPACSSFDQFRDFNHRGEVFQHLVRSLAGRGHGQEARV